MVIVTIDSGTTNSRIRVIEDGKIVAARKNSIGIKNIAITGSKDVFIENLEKSIRESVAAAGRSMKDVEYFAASGMITCDLGLCEIPHKIAPISMKALAVNVAKRNFPQISDMPFYFIPGVKNAVEKNTMEFLCNMDMMRGEETETFGIMKLCGIQGPCLILLPGSHSKFVYINEKNEIERCSTTIAGELLEAVSKHTLLSSSLDNVMVEEINKEYILEGVKFEEKFGLSKALFAIRLMHTQLRNIPNQRANFLAGAIVSNDINQPFLQKLRDMGYKRIYIGGSSPLKDIFEVVLLNKCMRDAKIEVLSDRITEIASSIGAIEIIKQI